MAARASGSGQGVPIAALERLRNDWEARAREATAAARTADPGRRATLLGEARAKTADAADLNDLILGREHPSARRG